MYRKVTVLYTQSSYLLVIAVGEVFQYGVETVCPELLNPTTRNRRANSAKYDAADKSLKHN